jgi:hypothetical protein
MLDLPTFGRPIKLTNPLRITATLPTLAV